MSIIEKLQHKLVEIILELFGAEINSSDVQISPTRKEFDGDYTILVFPFVKLARKKPEVLANELGEALKNQVEEITAFNVIKGFLNLEFSDGYWKIFLEEVALKDEFGYAQEKKGKVMVEFSSPNTNKPLHLGHIRNILLGWSYSKIMEAAGNEVIRTQIVNDRGIAICRSMLAWKKFAGGATPGSTGIKGDHFVGKYYVEFAKRFSAEYKEWQTTDEAKAVFNEKAKENQSEEAFFKDYKNDYFNEYSLLGKEAKDLLIKWENGDEAVRQLWSQMNSWVYEGFEETYKKLQVEFDKLYYESETYLLGKELIEKGLSEDVFQQDNKRIWIDLEDVKLNRKTVIKSDGTSTYTSQDIGTAHIRYKEFGADKMVYVVADEQDNHFQVLFEILKRLDEPYAEGLHHLSYGMVDLPTGRMKSREGTVVDADDLMKEVTEAARRQAVERGDVDNLESEVQEETLRRIGMAALKFFILRVNPKKRMIFNPEESVDLQGQTGPYIQYSYVRINGVVKRAELENIDWSLSTGYQKLEPQEKDLLNILHEYPNAVLAAAKEYDPSHIAAFCYNLAKSYHKFWHDLSIFGADTPEAVAFRLKLSKAVGNTIKKGMDLLGIEMPERM